MNHHELLDELRYRAHREIGKRDDEGAFLDLTYRENQIFKGDDYRKMCQILDRYIARDKRIMIWTGMLIPVMLLVEYYLWSGSLVLDAAFALLISGVIGYGVKVGFSRITALENARLLFGLCKEFSSEPVA